MRKNHSQSIKTMSLTRGLASGAFISICITIIGAAVLSKMLEQGLLGWDNTGYVIALTILLSAFVGTAFSITRINRRKLLVCLESAGIYIAILLMITVLFFGGEYEAVGVSIALICSGSISALLLLTGKKGSNSRRNRRKYC